VGALWEFKRFPRAEGVPPKKEITFLKKKQRIGTIKAFKKTTRKTIHTIKAHEELVAVRSDED